jgi:hypothetical protein
MRKPLVRLKHAYRETKAGLKTHFVDSTALLTVSNPVFSVFETMAASMTNENSIRARGIAAVLTYAGMGKLFTGGMKLSRKFFKIKQTDSEKRQQFHDASYATAYNLVISPPFYYFAGVRDFKQIAIGTATAAGLALIAGGPIGYAVDAYEDLVGLKECERLPLLVRKQNRAIKTGLAGLLVAASVGARGLIYYANSHYVHPSKETSQSLVQNR